MRRLFELVSYEETLLLGKGPGSCWWIATFPSDIPHGHFVNRHGPRRLEKWGLPDKVAARTPGVASMIYDAGEATRFLKARNGLIEPAEFFNPQNLRRLLGGARRHQPDSLKAS